MYSIGIDIENKNNHFIHCDLADYSELFGGGSELFKKLDNLPKPDIILASPPCESWSIASAMLGGNRSWYTQRITTLFGESVAPNPFTIRTKEQAESKNHTPYKCIWWKSVYNRINGELCAFNTIRIIERYEPTIWVIENPQSSMIWRYLEQIQDFHGIKNLAYYNAYDDNFTKKPTVFYSNANFSLKKDHIKQNGQYGYIVSRRYNERSKIPLELIKDILGQCIKKLDICTP